MRRSKGQKGGKEKEKGWGRRRRQKGEEPRRREARGGKGKEGGSRRKIKTNVNKTNKESKRIQTEGEIEGGKKGG